MDRAVTAMVKPAMPRGRARRCHARSFQAAAEEQEEAAPERRLGRAAIARGDGRPEHERGPQALGVGEAAGDEDGEGEDREPEEREDPHGQPGVGAGTAAVMV